MFWSIIEAGRAGQAFRQGVAGATWAACPSRRSCRRGRRRIATTYPVKGRSRRGPRALSRRSCGGRRRTGGRRRCRGGGAAFRVQGLLGGLVVEDDRAVAVSDEGRAEVGEVVQGAAAASASATTAAARRYWTFWSPGLGWVRIAPVRPSRVAVIPGPAAARVPQERSADNAATPPVSVSTSTSRLVAFDGLDRANRDVVDRHLTGGLVGETLPPSSGTASRRAGRLGDAQLNGADDLDGVVVLVGETAASIVTLPCCRQPWTAAATAQRRGVGRGSREARRLGVPWRNAANDSSAGARRRSCRSSVWSPGRLSCAGVGDPDGNDTGRVGRGPVTVNGGQFGRRYGGRRTAQDRYPGGGSSARSGRPRP